MSPIKAVFLFIFLSLVITQGSETAEKPTSNSTETNKTKEETITTDEINDEDIEPTNRTTSNRTYSRRRPEYDKFRPFNLSNDEMDKMIFCTFVIQNTLKDKKDDLIGLQKKMNLTSPNIIYEKIGTDMFEKCNKNADINIVNKYIKNLTYLRFYQKSKFIFH